MSIAEVFTYTERVANAAQSFLKLTPFIIRNRLNRAECRDFVAAEWQVEPLDLDEKVWEIKNK